MVPAKATYFVEKWDWMLRENINVAFTNLKANKGRASLTILIIAIGIVALVAILTSLDILVFKLSDNFSRLGANSFQIMRYSEEIQTSDGGRRRKRGEPIAFDQALEFKEKYDFPATVSVSLRCYRDVSVKYGGNKTNPTMPLYGIDENYLTNTKYDLAAGRNFSMLEVNNGHNRAILGNDIVKTLFEGKTEKALNKTVSIGNVKYKVVGTLESKGSSSNQFSDRAVLIPLINAKNYYGNSKTNYNVSVSVNNAVSIDDAISSATGLLRNIRGLRAAQENDFEFRKSDGLIDIIKENTVAIRLGIIFIGIITLLGAAIGLMNIMLVSVTERTREIGIIKAVGATRRNVLTQFLTEAIVICQMGGLIGIVAGIIIGFIVSAIVGGRFIIPWNWMFLAFMLCMIVGLMSGLYPALKASRLDPIESLRYE